MRISRVLLLLPAVIVSPALAMSKDDCQRIADRFGGALPAMRSIEENLSGTIYRPFVYGTPALDDAATQADAARESLIEPLRAYIAAMEDMTYQLQRCARQ